MTADQDQNHSAGDTGRDRDPSGFESASTPSEQRLHHALDRVATNHPVPDAWTTIRARATGAEPNQGAIPMAVPSMSKHSPGRQPRLALMAAAVAAVVAMAATVLVLANRNDADTNTTRVAAGPSTPVSDPPRRGGTLRYGVSNIGTTGYCLVELNAGPAMQQVVRSLYDTLTVPNGDGSVVPYLATALTPNTDHTVWDITLRSGVTFHDDSPLTADVVKNNLDAYRGQNPNLSSLLHLSAFENIDSISVQDELTVRVTMKSPWVAFPAALSPSAGVGIMAQAQLDSDHCSTEPIGTGPFSFVDLDSGSALTVKRNPHYWQIAPDGEPYPYADAIEFTEVDPTKATALLASGRLDVLRTDDPGAIGTTLPTMVDDGKAELTTSNPSRQVAMIKLNTTSAPFDDLTMRRALALSLDRPGLGEGVGPGLVTANGPFAPGTMGHLDDTGFPGHDRAEAKRLVDAYEASGRSTAFQLHATKGTYEVSLANAISDQAADAGFAVEVVEVQMPELIGALIAKSYQAAIFDGEPADDPDQNFIWWNGGINPLNFGGFDDPYVDDLLDTGRGEADPAARRAIYEDLNRHLAEQVYDVWLWFRPWAVATRPSIGSVTGPPLPGPDPGTPGEATTGDPSYQPSTDLSLTHSLLTLAPRR